MLTGAQVCCQETLCSCGSCLHLTSWWEFEMRSLVSVNSFVRLTVLTAKWKYEQSHKQALFQNVGTKQNRKKINDRKKRMEERIKENNV